MLEELLVTSLEEELCTQRQNWFNHVHQMEDYRLPKHHPKVRGQQPRLPLKRLLDDVNAEHMFGLIDQNM